MSDLLDAIDDEDTVVSGAPDFGDDLDLLRACKFGPMVLKMWTTNRCDRRGQSYIRYDFRRFDATEPLFAGEDFAGSPMCADDSDETVQALMSFLTLKPGDTDSEYFDNYTQEQLEWTQSQDAESVRCEVEDCSWENLGEG